MSTKLFCDRCNAEISLAGNPCFFYALVEGFKVGVWVKKEAHTHEADICRACTIALAKEAIPGLKP
jgi:hypothetical protein